MAPVCIADSDDESEGNTFSPPPAAQAEEPASFSSESDPVSLATSSTDPVYFQGIYKEQIAAAREQQGEQSQLRGSGLLPRKAPTGTEQTDPVSLPSQYPEHQSFESAVPHHSGSANRGHRAVKSVIIQGKMRQEDDGEVVIDPWAFPSSAEEQSVKVTKKTGLSRVASPPAAYRGTAEHGPGEDKGMGPPSRKRQRLDGHQGEDIESSLPPTALPVYSSPAPTMSIGNEPSLTTGADASASNPAPTLSIGNDRSLIINPRGLTSSQKQEYTVVEPPISSNPNQEQPHEETVNQKPPRSSAQSQDRSTPRKKAKPSRQTAARTKRLLDQSPAVERTRESLQLGTPELMPEGKPAIVLPDSEDEGCGEVGTQIAQPEAPDDEVNEIRPSPVRATKKRGRPKKAEKQKADDAAAQPEGITSQSTRKKPKKRGRPRKSDPAIVEDEGEAADVEVDKASDEYAEADEASRNVSGVTGTNAAEAVASEGIQAQCKDAEVVAAPAKTTAQKAQDGRRDATPQQGGTGKPIYRIGLSKRSRIAPLLKSLPK